MEYSNVLALTDFSKDSEEAVRTAVDFVQKYGSRLTLLHRSPISVFVTRK